MRHPMKLEFFVFLTTRGQAATKIEGWGVLPHMLDNPAIHMSWFDKNIHEEAGNF